MMFTDAVARMVLAMIGEEPCSGIVNEWSV